MHGHPCNRGTGKRWGTFSLALGIEQELGKRLSIQRVFFGGRKPGVSCEFQQGRIEVYPVHHPVGYGVFRDNTRPVGNQGMRIPPSVNIPLTPVMVGCQMSPAIVRCEKNQGIICNAVTFITVTVGVFQ